MGVSGLPALINGELGWGPGRPQAIHLTISSLLRGLGRVWVPLLLINEREWSGGIAVETPPWLRWWCLCRTRKLINIIFFVYLSTGKGVVEGLGKGLNDWLTDWLQECTNPFLSLKSNNTKIINAAQLIACPFLAFLVWKMETAVGRGVSSTGYECSKCLSEASKIREY